MTVDKQEAALASLAEPRQRAYAFLSAAFLEPPTADALAGMRRDSILDPAAELFSEATLAPLRQFAATAMPAEELHHQARQAFMNLFKVPGGQYVTPYESVYRDTRDIAGRPIGGLLMGPSAVAVRQWYRLAAVEISDEYRDLPDHIGLELNYLAHLCTKEQQLTAAHDRARMVRAWEMERDFLAAHVVSWIDELRARILAKTRHPYFRAVAEMADEFCGRDLTTLEGVVGPSNRSAKPQYEKTVP